MTQKPVCIIRMLFSGSQWCCVRKTLVVCLAMAVSTPSAATVICSWNIKHLGWGEQKSYAALAHVGNLCDVIAVQEAMDADGMQRLERALEGLDSSWDFMSSHAIGRGSYKEQYAFYWRSSKVEYLDGAVVFLDHNDVYAREPYSARFRAANGRSFALASIHVLYGDGISDRLPEIRKLAEYWSWLAEVYPGTDVILAGDFNLPPDHDGFGPLRKVAKAVVTTGATTLSSRDGRYANLYDNLWVSRNHGLSVSDSGIIRFPELLRTSSGNGVTHEWARKHVSDHAPVYVALDGSRLGGASSDRALAPARGREKQRAVTSTTNTAAGINVRGNRNSKIYHLPSCPSYARVGEHNRVPFESEAAARGAGYRKAGNC